MSREIVMDEPTDDAPPPQVAAEDTKLDTKRKTKPASSERDTDTDPVTKDEGPRAPRDRAYHSSALKEMRAGEDSTIKDIIESLGTDGAFKIAIKRTFPDEARDPATGKMIPTAGHLTTVDHAIDEDWLQRKFGGGKFELIFRRKNEAGSFKFAGQKTLTVAGEPIIADLPRSAPAVIAGGVASNQESPTVVNKAMDMMERQLAAANDRARDAERPVSHGPDPAISQMLEMLQSTIKLQAEEMQQMRRDLMAAGTKKPEADPFKDQFLSNLIAGDSARIEAVRTRYESELRQTKDFAVENERRLRDQFEREKSEILARNERDLAMLRQSHENTLMVIRQSHEISLGAARGSYETQGKLSDADNRRLERDNADLRVEVKELRAKKEKGVIETIKEMEAIKDAVGGDSEDKGIGAQIAEALLNPEAIGAIGGMFKKPEAVAAPAPQQQLAERRPQVFQGENGQFFKVVEGKLVPVKRKKKPRPAQAVAAAQAAAEGSEAPAEAEAAEAEEPEEEVMPELPEGDREMLVRFLESAQSGGQDPAVVAQGLRPRIPPDAMAFLSTKMTELGVPRGVDLFLVKIAQVPATSALMSQVGRNWVRALARELVGE